MRTTLLLTMALLLFASPTVVWAQRNAKKDAEFVKAQPAVGDALPELSVFTPDGKEFQTAALRGQYTVITFGCLT